MPFPLNARRPRVVTPDSRDSTGQARDRVRTHGRDRFSVCTRIATLSDMNRGIVHADGGTATGTRQFTLQLSATRRGARLARLLATEQLRSWGLPLDAAAHVVAELAANAALHGRVPGRDFRLALTVHGPTLRIEVTDARAERLPAPVTHPADGEAGRGLLLVEALADRWGVTAGPVPCKTVWAEISLYTATASTASHLPRPGEARHGAARRG